MSRNRKLKTYIAISVLLMRVPREHVAPNGARQFTILCKAKSQAEVAKLVGCSLYDLRNFSGVTEAPVSVGFSGERMDVSEIVRKDGVIYYCNERTREWFEYKGKASNEG